jgi:PAS domain S-box-containing protein
MSKRENQKSDRINPAETDDFQRQLIAYQERIENILESFTDAFFEVDCNWIVTYWNKEAERLLEMPREKMIGQNLWEMYADAVPLKFFQEYHKAMEDMVAVRFEEYFAPKKLWLEVAAFPSGKGLSIYFKDITASKNALNLLHEERQNYIDLFNQSPLPQWVYDSETLEFLDVNEAAVTHYGYSREEFLSMTIKDIRPPEEIQQLKLIVSNKLIKNRTSQHAVRHRKKNGELISVFVEGNSISFEEKKARLVIVIDRTSELKAIKDMQESVNRFNIVSNATSDAVWDWNIGNGEIIWNQGIKAIFGYPETNYTHKWWRDHVHPEDLEQVLRNFDALVENHVTRLEAEYRFRCADGSYRFVLDRAFIIFDNNGGPERIIGSMQDITKRVNDLKAMEMQNERLREISWIQSHKLRSPVAKILGLVELISVCQEDQKTLNELIPLLETSASELDGVIKEIVKKTE